MAATPRARARRAGGGGGGGGGDGEMLAALAELLDTDGSQLGLGRDADKSIKYSRLELAAAWQVDCEPSVYEARLRKVAQQMNTIARQGCMPPEPTKGRPYRTDPVRMRLGLASDGVAAEANEALLVHGTSPALLLPLLSEGCLNERFSGAFKRRPAFGDGVYLAEDAGKADQYCEADGEYDRLSELHRLLYPRGADAHPGGPLHFLLVCRVALGAPIRTHTTGRASTSLDPPEVSVFPRSYRELAPVAGVTPPTPYHSLLVEKGAGWRFREFVLMHGEGCLPVFLVAYRRR